MASLSGMQIVVRRWSLDGQVIEPDSQLRPAAVDLLCVNDEGGALVGAAAGSDFVQLDLAAYKNLSLPRVRKTASGRRGIGCVHWSEGSKANGAKVWVRVFGRHPYAKVEGTTDVAIDDMLASHATGGAVAKTTTIGDHYALALAAQAANSVQPAAVLLSDPGHLITI